MLVDAQINIHVTREERTEFLIACIKMGTTMSSVLRDTVRETIVRASLMPGGAALAQKGDGDG